MSIQTIQTASNSPLLLIRPVHIRCRDVVVFFQFYSNCVYIVLYCIHMLAGGATKTTKLASPRASCGK